MKHRWANGRKAEATQVGTLRLNVRHPEAAGVLTELLFEGDPRLGPDPPGAVVRPERVPGSDPPAMEARFDIVLRR